MDTSETYIKMCDCEEIQEQVDNLTEPFDKFSFGVWHAPNHVQCKGHFTDWHMAYKYCPVCGKKLKVTPEFSIVNKWKDDDNIWLPRQDQLQEMLGCKNSQTDFIILDKIYKWMRKDVLSIKLHKSIKEAEDRFIPNSMEQLWLAFVMKEKHGKTWDGQWIK